MQSDKSDKPVRPRTTGKKDEVLSPLELARADKGVRFKRVVRSTAARRDLYDDAAIAREVGVSRNTVAAWWRGSDPGPEALKELARVMDMSAAELFALLYLPEAASSGVQEGIRRDQERQQREDPPTPAPSPERRPRGSGAGRG